jgi:hypothetical protein
VIGAALVLGIAAAWLLRRWAHRQEEDAEQRRLTGSFNRAKSKDH